MHPQRERYGYVRIITFCSYLEQGPTQCCGSGKFTRNRIFSIPDPGSASKNWSILAQKMVSKLSEIWSGLFIPDPNFLPFLDPWVKKTPLSRALTRPNQLHWTTEHDSHLSWSTALHHWARLSPVLINCTEPLSKTLTCPDQLHWTTEQDSPLPWHQHCGTGIEGTVTF